MPSNSHAENDQRYTPALLDELLEKYLNLLHDYQTERNNLNDILSKGWMSLAQANFNSQSPTKYGPDYYDNRMQASRRAILDMLDDHLVFEISKISDLTSEEKLTKDESDEVLEEPKASKEGIEGSPLKKLSDPINWFGILVPQALRTAQESFIRGVAYSIPQLSTIQSELQNMESRIRQCRKSLDSATRENIA